MPAALTREQLDAVALKGCATPGCNHDHDKTIYFHGRCHIKARVDVSYSYGEGKIVITCSECHNKIAEVAVLSASSS